VSRIDREHLIERYLRGELSPAQEERFFIEIATNKELRHELKAYRIVDETLVRDSRRLAAPQTALRARLEQQMSGMQATAPAAPAAASSTPAATGGIAGATMVPLKWLLVALVGAGLAIGGLVVSSLSERTPFTRAASTQPHVTTAPGLIEEPQHDTIAARTPASGPAMTTDNATPTESALKRSASRIEPDASSATQKKGNTNLLHVDTAGRHLTVDRQRRNDIPMSLGQFQKSASGRSISNRDTSPEGSATIPVIIGVPKPMDDNP
jgi:hypothetical protein